MLALVNTPGGPAALECRQIADPVPRPWEALIDVRAFSLNRGELASFARNRQGWVPGQDVAGVVLRAAADGSGPPEGARVVALVDDSGWAQRVAAPVDRIAVLADSVSFAQAAALPIAGLTALRCLRFGGLLLGRRVLVTGAAGGVGTLAVQLAARAGALVTAVVGSAARGAVLAGLGADTLAVGIGSAEGRFALVLESAGGESLARAVRLVEPAGTVVVYGNSSQEPASLSFADFRGAPNARVQTFSYHTSEPVGRFGADLAVLAGLVAEGSLRPVIGIERDWREVLEVGALLRERQVAGKAVLAVGG